MTPRARARAVIMAVAWVVMMWALVQSLDVFFAWRKGELQALQPSHWFWLALLPVWLVVYLRVFSIFRPDCLACAPPKDEKPVGPKGA